eukprot:Partr_v1_DN28163_c0_g1_i2_m55913 putative Ammonium transporter
MADPAAQPPVSLIEEGDTAWILMSSAMVMLMIPGLGYFYSGLAQHKNALSLIFLSMISLAVVSVQWFLWGYSLAFGSGGPFIGNLDNAFYLGLFDGTGYLFTGIVNIPGVAFMVYQGMFAAITPALAIGAACERTRIIPLIVFIFLWSTLVYDFIAYWTWSASGFLRIMGSLDFAGGTPVHISSGAAAVAYSLVTGKRDGHGRELYKPHNLSSVFLGTALLWFGWFGFNGGSALAASQNAVLALVNTNLSAASGALTWCIIEYRTRKKFSAFAFCCGAVAGLVTITPGAGFVAPWASFLFGVVGATCCNTFVRFKDLYGFDDALDVFGVHGVGGVVGNLLTGIFASKLVNPALVDGGWMDGHYMQFLYQLAGSCAGLVWSFTLTYLILFIMNCLSYLNLRLHKDKEMIGLDRAQLGESAYDYIEAAVGSDGHDSNSSIRSAGKSSQDIALSGGALNGSEIELKQVTSE